MALTDLRNLFLSRPICAGRLPGMWMPPNIGGISTVTVTGICTRTLPRKIFWMF